MANEITFEDVYRAHAPRVYRFCLSILRNPAAAEDIANTAFESAFKAFDRRPEDPEKIISWLMRIAYNAAVDDLRKNTRWRRLHDRIGRQTNIQTEDPVRHVELRADVSKVLDAIAQLRPKDQKFLWLRLGGELSYADAAEVVKMSERAVAVATRRAMERLRESLGEEE